MEQYEIIEIRVYGHKVQMRISHQLLYKVNDPEKVFQKMAEDVLRQMFETVFKIGFGEMFKQEKIK